MKKQRYVNRLQGQLAHLSEKVSDLEHKADRAETQSGLPSSRPLERLREKERTVHRRLQELGQAGEDAWDKVRNGVDSARTSIEEAFEAVRDMFEAAADRVSGRRE